MKLTLFLDKIVITFPIKKFNHYGKGFYCFEADLSKEFLDYITYKVIYKQHSGNFTLGRDVKFEIGD